MPYTDVEIKKVIHNYLTQAQYDALVGSGGINANELYYITDSNELERLANKQNSLVVDGTGTKYPTVDAVNTVLGDIETILASI